MGVSDRISQLSEKELKLSRYLSGLEHKVKRYWGMTLLIECFDILLWEENINIYQGYIKNLTFLLFLQNKE